MSTKTETSPNLYRRLLNITKAVGYIQKDGVNSFHKYRYVSEAALLEKLREACVENGVMVLPSVTKHERFPVPETQGKDYPGDITFVETSYTLVNVDNPEERAVVIAIGYGQNKGDKGAYSAMTGSYKYFGLKTFQISSGDDPEKDEPVAKAPDGTPYHPRTGEVVEQKKAPVSPPTKDGKNWKLEPEGDSKKTYAGTPQAVDWTTFKYKYALPPGKSMETHRAELKQGGAKWRPIYADNARTQLIPGGDNAWYSNQELPDLMKYCTENKQYNWGDSPPPGDYNEGDIPDWMKDQQ